MEPMTPRKAATLPSSMRRRLMMMAAATLALATAATACSDTKTSSTSTTSAPAANTAPTGKTIDYATLTGTLNGSGSSFQDTLEQKAKTLFAAKATNVTVNYTKSGSKAGKADLANQIKQFAGTDSAVGASDPPFKGGDILYFPIAAAPITIAFHVTGLTQLSLTADTLAGIFQGDITTWNDPKIAADNSGITLPSTKIAVVRRSDGSGTTSNFTKYLKKASPLWKLDAGDTVQWPASTVPAEKSSGVATTISKTDGAVGYVDLADAANANLDMAKVKNKAGTFVAPTLDAASAALEGTTPKADLTYDPLDAPGAAAYPITSPTWVIVYKKQPDAATAQALIGYLNFFLTDVQVAAKGVGYAALPSSLQQKAVAQLDQITS